MGKTNTLILIYFNSLTTTHAVKITFGPSVKLRDCADTGKCGSILDAENEKQLSWHGLCITE